MKRIFLMFLVVVILCLNVNLVACSNSNGNLELSGEGNVLENTQHTHSMVEIPSVDATCYSEGKTAGKKCSECQAIIEEQQIIPKKEHTYSSAVTVEPTCTTKGIKKFTCDNCSNSYTEEFDLKVYTSSEIFEYVENSVVEIITYDKKGNEYALGSGFVYSSDGKIITNYHVIENGYSAKVTINDVDYSVNSVLAYDKNIDVAVLEINASNLLHVPVCSVKIKTGSVVYAIGSPKGLTATISNGIVTHSERELDGVIYIQHNAAISSGNSGGPLVNEYGEIIGINTFTISDSQNLNFAISVSELGNLNYDTPLTMAEFYNKECNALEKLKNYAISYGSYSYDNDWYKLKIGVSYSSDYSYKYERYLYYYIDEDYITLDLSVNGGEYWVYIKIDEIDGIYFWSYFDDYDYMMNGTIYAATFDTNTLLGYSYNNISNSSLRVATRRLASSLVSLLCVCLEDDLSDIGITAYDIGFLQY